MHLHYTPTYVLNVASSCVPPPPPTYSKLSSSHPSLTYCIVLHAESLSCKNLGEDGESKIFWACVWKQAHIGTYGYINYPKFNYLYVPV